MRGSRRWRAPVPRDLGLAARHAQAGGRPAGQPFCVPSRTGPEGAGEPRRASAALIQDAREEQP